MFASVQQTGNICYDQTGRFKYISITEHQNLLILYAYDANAILAEPIKNRTMAEIIQAYTMTVTLLAAIGHKPQVN